MAVGFGAFKGTVIATVVGALGVQFWQSLVIAVTSGVIGAAGAVVAALIATRESRRNRDMLRDVKRKIGADQRQEDTAP